MKTRKKTKKFKELRKTLNVILAGVFIVLGAFAAEYNMFFYESLFQSFGICLYVAWLFIIRDN